ncbi:hypothetical protein A7975_23780 [Bacillus sp. FJAT-26390]|nr:hypothetical protein A7975_23780 [Bacillus sp. FJAT-26390]
MTKAGYISKNTNNPTDSGDELENVDVGDPGTPERDEFTKLFLKDFNELSEEAQKQIHALIKTWNNNKK